MCYKIIMVIKKIDKLIYQKYFFFQRLVCAAFSDKKKTTQIVEIELLQMKFEIDHTKLSTI